MADQQQAGDPNALAPQLSPKLQTIQTSNNAEFKTVRDSAIPGIECAWGQHAASIRVLEICACFAHAGTADKVAEQHCAREALRYRRVMSAGGIALQAQRCS